MKSEKIISKVKEFQKKLNEYYEETGDSIPDIETTCIGSSNIRYEVLNTKVKRFEVYDAPDNSRFFDEYMLSKESDREELEEQIKYDRRRLNKAWRVWKSENPDAELERDDEE